MLSSDLTRTSGRLWASDALWNVPLPLIQVGDPAATVSLHQTGLTVSWAVDAHAPTVTYLGPNARPETFPDDSQPVWLPPADELIRPWQTIIDLNERTVLTLDRWVDDNDHTHVGHRAVSLDGDGWGSTAVGLILERELLAGIVPHAVGLAGPAEFYGRRVILDDRAAGPTVAARRVGVALSVYGGIFTAACDDRIMVLCEHSAAAVAGDQSGILYRHLGITDDAVDVGVATAALTVLG